MIELERQIRGWINEWNKNPKSFIWAKAADEILDTLAAYRTRTTDSGVLVLPFRQRQSDST
ncbi:hypothetical protein GCM10023347_25320 [Streptomyces chumphonensis]